MVPFKKHYMNKTNVIYSYCYEQWYHREVMWIGTYSWLRDTKQCWLYTLKTKQQKILTVLKGCSLTVKLECSPHWNVSLHKHPLTFITISSLSCYTTYHEIKSYYKITFDFIGRHSSCALLLRPRPSTVAMVLIILHGWK